MNYRRVVALIKKEGFQAYKDPSSIITAFVFPLILLFLYGFGVSLDMNGIKIGIVMEDSSPLARSFVHSMMSTTYFKAQTVSSRKLAEEQLTDGTINGIVIIPSYFTEYYYNKSTTAPLQVIADGSDPNTAQFAQNYIRGAWYKWNNENAIEDHQPPPVSVAINPRVWYNEQLSSHYFLIPGSIVVIMTVTGALLTSLVIAREWERGTMEALMSTPATMGEIIISKLTAYFILAVGAMLLCFFVARYIYFVPFRGSYFALSLSSFAYLSFALGMGLLISISVRDQFAASQIAIVSTYLPAFILSGFIFDISSMPLYLRIITNFVPAKYFVKNLKTLFLVGDVWEVLLPNILIMSAFSLGVFLLIKRKSVKRLD
jgi:ABC-2 type transport system permease protein